MGCVIPAYLPITLHIAPPLQVSAGPSAKSTYPRTGVHIVGRRPWGGRKCGGDCRRRGRGKLGSPVARWWWGRLGGIRVGRQSSDRVLTMVPALVNFLLHPSW